MKSLEGSDSFRVIATLPVAITQTCVIPRKCVISNYELRQGIPFETSRTVLTVKDVEANKVGDAVFRVGTPENSVVIDKTAKGRDGVPLDKPLITVPD